MAASITTNADLVTYEVLPDVEIRRLSTGRTESEDPPWITRHKMAWRATLLRLKRRVPSLEEADLDDTDEIKLATCYHVAYLAYKWGPMEDDMKKAEYHYHLWERELETIDITSGGETLEPGGYGFRETSRS